MQLCSRAPEGKAFPPLDKLRGLQLIRRTSAVPRAPASSTGTPARIRTASSDIELPGNFEYRLGVYAGLLGLEDGRGIEPGLLHGPLMASAAISFLLVGAYPFLVGHERRRMDGRGNNSHQNNDGGVATYLAQSLHFEIGEHLEQWSWFQA